MSVKPMVHVCGEQKKDVNMRRDKQWQKFEDYIAEILKEIDPYCSRTPGSGNKGIKGDIRFNENIQN